VARHRASHAQQPSPPRQAGPTASARRRNPRLPLQSVYARSSSDDSDAILVAHRLGAVSAEQPVGHRAGCCRDLLRSRGRLVHSSAVRGSTVPASRRDVPFSTGARPVRRSHFRFRWTCPAKTRAHSARIQQPQRRIVTVTVPPELVVDELLPEPGRGTANGKRRRWERHDDSVLDICGPVIASGGMRRSVASRGGPRNTGCSGESVT
jgi:hypothetical protein